MSVVKNLYVKGNLQVFGTTFSSITENDLITNRFTIHNSELTSGTASGGIAINYSSVASVSATTFDSLNDTITCDDLTASLTDGNSDFILVSGTVNNNGIFEVLSRTSTTIVIDTSPTANYIANTSLVNETISSTISVVSVCIIQSSGLGVLGTSTSSNGQGLSTGIKSVFKNGDTLTSPTLLLTGNSNQLILDSGGSNPTTLSTQATPSGSYTYKIPDAGGNADFVMTESVQTISGVKTFSNNPVMSGITNTGTLTLPITTDTLVGRSTIDTLSNKIIVSSITSHADTSPTLTITSLPINTFTPSVGRVITLPAVAVAVGHTYKFILMSGVGSCIITPPDGSIDGLSTFTLDEPNQSTSLTSDGNVWHINL
jgi:hypothetical protein